MTRSYLVKALMAVLLLVFHWTSPLALGEESASQVPVIALIGATSRSGREIIDQALARGYSVKGLARTPSKLETKDPRLALFRGDVRDQASLEAMLDGNEVVVCMVGLPTPKDPTAEVGQVDLYTVMARNLTAAMKAKGNRRLIIASSTGVEHRVPVDAPAPLAQDMGSQWRWNARHLYNDMYEMERMIQESGLDHIILRPGFLTQAPRRDDVQLTTSGDTPPGREITYADFAAFVIGNLDATEYLNRAVGLYSDRVMDPKKELEKFLATQKE